METEGFIESELKNKESKINYGILTLLEIVDTNIERNYTGLTKNYISEAKCSGTVIKY